MDETSIDSTSQCDSSPHSTIAFLAELRKGKRSMIRATSRLSINRATHQGKLRMRNLSWGLTTRLLLLMYQEIPTNHRLLVLSRRTRRTRALSRLRRLKKNGNGGLERVNVTVVGNPGILRLIAPSTSIPPLLGSPRKSPKIEERSRWRAASFRDG